MPNASAPAQAPAPAQPRRTTVAGIIALVLGVIALILSFIPIVNNLAAVLGVIGAVFAIVALVGTFRGRKHGKGLAVAGAVVCVLSVVITLAMQSATVKAIDDATKTAKGIDTSQNTGTQSGKSDDANDGEDDTQAAAPSGEQDLEGDIEGAHVRIVSAARSNNDYEGKATVLVTYEWTNTTEKNNSFAALANPQVFQNGTALDTAIYMDNPAGYDSGSYLAEAQPNATATVTLGYVLEDDSPVTVEVSALFSVTSDAKVSHVFSLS